MSEPIPESIPTSADPRSKRPVKKARGPQTAISKQSSEVEALFAHPEREIKLPSGPRAKSLAPPPEIVANVQGSSAGAGSGEFHVYKASRRREYERLRLMDEEVRKEEGDKVFESKREELKKKDEAKTNKNKARRDKKKANREKGKGKGADGDDSQMEVEANGTKADALKNGLKPMVLTRDKSDDEVEMGGEVKNVDEIGIVIHDED